MESKDKKKIVSYSQYSKWFVCPRRFFLEKVMGLEIKENNIHTCFGTAMHEAVQKYVQTLYTESSPKADALDLNQIYLEAFDRELLEKNVEYTQEEYFEFTNDAKNIIREFCNSSNRIKYFPSGKYEFLGVELKINQPIKNNLEFMALIDLALKDKKTGRIKIIDFKTSSMGWNSYMKTDESKFSQILLYKALYSKKYNVPLSKIDVEFFILKRKLMENVSFPQNRIQVFVPANTSSDIKKSLGKFTTFINECFTTEGGYNDKPENYLKIPGKNKKNCKYCNYKNTKHCDGKSDV